MKRRVIRTALAPAAVASCMMSCNLMDISEQGEIRLSFIDSEYRATKTSGAEIPDTNDFILEIKSSDGMTIYDGKYGDAPECVKVEEGTYTVRVISSEFKAPQFSVPQFGDEQCVVVPPGGNADVRFECRQTNCGIRINIDRSFTDEYPSCVLWLQSDDGRLMYSHTETRTAYFNPGKVSVTMTDNARTETIYTRNMSRQEIFSLNLSAVHKSDMEEGAGLSISVDTTRNRTEDSIVIGDPAGRGKDMDNALTISQAKASAGLKSVWVSGFIVGGDLKSSANGISFKGPFSSDTNIAISSKSSAESKSSCMSVQLNSGTIREKLNLADNPENLGKRILIKGDIVDAYYGIPGIKNVSDFTFR